MRKIRIYVRVLLLLTTFAAVSSCQALMYEDAEMAPDTTVLVYMAADNNLAGNAERDIKEMMKGNIPYYFDEGSGNVLLVYADIVSPA